MKNPTINFHRLDSAIRVVLAGLDGTETFELCDMRNDGQVTTNLKEFLEAEIKKMEGEE